MDASIIAGAVGVVVGAIISGIAQIVSTYSNIKAENARIFSQRLISECYNLLDSAMILIDNVIKLKEIVIPFGVDQESEEAKAKDEAGVELLSKLFYSINEVKRLSYRVSVVGGENSAKIALEIRSFVDRYLHSVADNDFKFSSEEYSVAINDLHELLLKLTYALKKDLKIKA